MGISEIGRVDNIRFIKTKPWDRRLPMTDKAMIFELNMSKSKMKQFFIKASEYNGYL